jgi:hypothetical protein
LSSDERALDVIVGKSSFQQIAHRVRAAGDAAAKPHRRGEMVHPVHEGPRESKGREASFIFGGRPRGRRFSISPGFM